MPTGRKSTAVSTALSASGGAGVSVVVSTAELVVASIPGVVALAKTVVSDAFTVDPFPENGGAVVVVKLEEVPFVRAPRLRPRPRPLRAFAPATLLGNTLAASSAVSVDRESDDRMDDARTARLQGTVHSKLNAALAATTVHSCRNPMPAGVETHRLPSRLTGNMCVRVSACVRGGPTKKR